jgi:hypothetical protein
MAMGRPPTPTAVKKVMGNPGRRPLNAREPQPSPKTPPQVLVVSVAVAVDSSHTAHPLKQACADLRRRHW